MALATRDVKIRFTVEDKLSKSLAVMGKASEKLEPKLELVKQNLIVMQGRLEGVKKKTKDLADATGVLSQRMVDWGGKLARAGRIIGFTGFIMDFTVTRIMRVFYQFGRQAVSFVKNMGTTDAALNFLTKSLEALALTGELTPDMVGRITDGFWRWWNASAKLQAAFAKLMIEAEPFITTLLEVAAENIDIVVGAIQDMIAKEGLEGLVQKVRDAAEAFFDRLIPAIIDLIDRAPDVLDKIERLAGTLGSFSAGLVEGQSDMIDFFNTLIEHLPQFDAFVEKLGRLIPKIQTLGKILTVVGIPLTILGNILKVIGGIKLAGALGGLGAGAKATGIGAAGQTTLTAGAAAGITAGGLVAGASFGGLLAMGLAGYMREPETQRILQERGRAFRQQVGLREPGQNISVYAPVSIGTMSSDMDLEDYMDAQERALARGVHGRYTP